MAILNPINGAAVAGMSAELAAEGRLQSLLRLWYGSYFSGAPFQTRTITGGQTTIQFMAMDFMWQEDEIPENPQSPLLHTILTPVHVESDRTGATEETHTDTWQADMLVRVPVNLSGTPFKGRNPEHVVRQAADQVQWLYCSSEREALSVHGVHEIRLTSAPRILAGTSWHARILTATLKQFRSQPV